MKIDFLPEPELEFGSGRHVDIRFGLMNYGPFDVNNTVAPKSINCGIVGTPETVEGLVDWLERCRGELTAKQSAKPNLFPRFPGFNEHSAFHSTLILDGRLQRTIPDRTLNAIHNKANEDEIVRETVHLFINEFEHLVQSTTVDVLICAVPGFIASLTGSDDSERGSEKNDPAPGRARASVDFHHLLKAQAMNLGRPIQLVLPSTYDPSKRARRARHGDSPKKRQDDATIAWNIHAAMYYKAGGTPWRLVRDSSQLATCYVGVSFYQALDGSSLGTSMAQVFDERGDGLIVRGGPVRMSKEDRQPHLSSIDSLKLLQDALRQYRAVHKTLPARVVMHKTSTYNDEELEGFRDAGHEERIELLDFVSTGRSLSETRLFRHGAYPTLRGTFLSLDDRHQLLYTRGSVEFFSTYPGMYVPRPFAFRCEDGEQTPKHLAREILALTKMNWNDTQFDGGEPITVEAARRVGAILKYVGATDRIAPRYSFYM